MLHLTLSTCGILTERSASGRPGQIEAVPALATSLPGSESRKPVYTKGMAIRVRESIIFGLAIFLKEGPGPKSPPPT
jgi:hypothetical protein